MRDVIPDAVPDALERPPVILAVFTFCVAVVAMAWRSDRHWACLPAGIAAVYVGADLFRLVGQSATIRRNLRRARRNEREIEGRLAQRRAAMCDEERP